MKNFFLILLALSISACNNSANTRTIDLVIKDNKFVTPIIEAKENETIKIIVRNEDASVEEFESHDLKREKIVPAKGTVTVVVGPLKKGEYKFFGEFHEATCQGKLIIN